MGKTTLALALGGGAARGWAHIGVLRTLQSAGLEPDLVVGTSIGAIVGAHHVVGRLSELETFAHSLTRRKFFSYLDVSMTGSGLITGQRLFELFNQFLSNSKIESLDRRFVAIATELSTGHEVWLQRGSIVDAIRASSAIPGIVRPINVRGRWLVDGSLVNPIPVSVCRAFGADVVVAVNLNGDTFGRGGTLLDLEVDAEHHLIPEEPATRKLNGGPALQFISSKFFTRGNETAPTISSVILDAFSIVHDRIARARLMGDPPDLMIAPDLAGIGSFDVHRAEEMIALGVAAAQEQIGAIERRMTAARIRIGHPRKSPLSI